MIGSCAHVATSGDYVIEDLTSDTVSWKIYTVLVLLVMFAGYMEY